MLADDGAFGGVKDERNKVFRSGRVVVPCLTAASVVTTMSRRQASISRQTSETQIEVSIDLDCAAGSGVKQVIDVSTGIGFLDHVCFPVITLRRSQGNRCTPL